jgi:stage II sporulation protein D
LGRTTPVNSLKIIGNEKVSFHIGASGTIDFLEIELSPSGASSDRYSPVASWDVNLTLSVVADKLRSLAGTIGQIRDLKPFRLGNSGRVVQIQVLGSRSTIVLNGYKVRNALGLKDTLFTLTRDYNQDGSIASFTFHGRGWGHGVGLCQVGAFGMARAGYSYEDILKTYYQGVEIQKAY